MTDSDFEKNLLFMKPLKEIEEEWIKKLRLYRIFQRRTWAPDQMCTMTGTVDMTFQINSFQRNPLRKSKQNKWKNWVSRKLTA